VITATSRSPVRRSYKCGIVERWQFFLYLIIGGLSFIVEIATFIALRRAAAPSTVIGGLRLFAPGSVPDRNVTPLPN
jgi:hypothetical protein